MPTCPVCGSDMVYPLLNTLRCKRCKHIWKAGEETPDTCGCQAPDTALRVRKRTDPLETRLERRLEECIRQSKGKFCLTTLSWQAGDIPQELFRRYLKRCVKNRALEESKDTYGRIWYSRPGWRLTNNCPPPLPSQGTGDPVSTLRAGPGIRKNRVTGRNQHAN
jgi:hypothetical protein